MSSRELRAQRRLLVADAVVVVGGSFTMGLMWDLLIFFHWMLLATVLIALGLSLWHAGEAVNIGDRDRKVAGRYEEHLEAQRREARKALKRDDRAMLFELGWKDPDEEYWH